MIKFIGLFIYEYIGNHIVNAIPFSYLRYLFYRYVMKVKCNKNVYFQMGIYIYSSKGQLQIGDHTIVNRNCTLDRRGDLIIGSNVNISPESSIFTAGHIINDNLFKGIKQKTIIEDYVWLGTRSMVMPGVKIGKGAVVLPGSIVTKNVQSMDIVGGIPAIKIGTRKSKLCYELSWRPWFM